MTGDDEYAQTQARLWDLLRLRPARKAAEWALADRLASQGDQAGADAHRLVAAALDPDYKDARHDARLLLGGTTHRVALVGKSRSAGLGPADRPVAGRPDTARSCAHL